MPNYLVAQQLNGSGTGSFAVAAAEGQEVVQPTGAQQTPDQVDLIQLVQELTQNLKDLDRETEAVLMMLFKFHDKYKI